MNQSLESVPSRPRPTPEGVALSLAFTQTTYLHRPAQIALTLLISEQLKHLSPEQIGALALSAFALTAILGYWYEAETLRVSGFNCHYAANLAYLKVDNPYAANLIATFWNQLSYFINPVDVGSTATSLLARDGGHFLFANLLARSAVGFTNSLVLNSAIRLGHAEKILAKIHDSRVALARQIHTYLEDTGVLALDEALFPPSPYIDYPDNTSGDFHARHPLITHQNRVIK